MVPRIASSGRSFKGAAQYYLHDKKASTDDRVAFVETVNLPTDDRHRAVAHMVDTATHADQLKQAAGLKAGRALQKPVYCYSLAWHPTESPSREDQLKAARDTLSLLGFGDRQAMIIGHSDTDHPHVHVIVNRVCPETGRAASTSQDRIKLSNWAEQYERDQGRILCENRVENNQARRQGQWRKDESLSRRQQYEWKKAQSDKLWADYRADRDTAKGPRKAQYEALWRQKEERFAARKDEIKRLYKPVWRDVFQRQSQELKAFDSKLSKRLAFALSQTEGSKFMAVIRAIAGDRVQRQAFMHMHEAERNKISSHQRQDIRDAGREITKAWQYDRDQLKAMHMHEDQARLDHYKGVSDQLWENDQGHAAKQDFEQETKPEKKRKSAREIIEEKRSRSRGRTRTRRPRR